MRSYLLTSRALSASRSLNLLSLAAPAAAAGAPWALRTTLYEPSRSASSLSSSTAAATATATAAAGSNPAFRGLYKSSHKGSGNTPIPAATPQRPKARAKKAKDMEAGILGSRSSCAEDAGPVPDRPLSPLQKRQLMMKNKAAFVLTPQALRRVKYLISQYGKNQSSGEEVPMPTGIRIGVRRRGCSGYSYTVNYYFPPAEAEGTGDAAPVAARKSRAGGVDDVVVQQDGVRVVVDGDALFYVIGTEMDYVVRNVEEKFTFKNPNQKYGCGCEESFMPFDEDDMDD